MSILVTHRLKKGFLTSNPNLSICSLDLLSLSSMDMETTSQGPLGEEQD